MRAQDQQRLMAALPYIVMAVFFVRSCVLLYAPASLQTERLWLEWLGNQILTNGAIPHHIGHEALASSGSYWTPQAWLFAVGIAWCAAHHLDLCSIGIVACIATIPLYVTYARLRNSNTEPAALTLAVIFVAYSLDTTIQMRASICSYAATSLVFAAISCNDKRQFSIPFIILFLTNIHATTIFLTAIPCLAFLAAIAPTRSYTSQAHRLLMISIASVIASLCSPFGYELYHYAFSLTSGQVHRYVSEWTPILQDLSSPLSLIQLCESAVLTILIACCWKKSPFAFSDIIILIVTGALMLYAERFAPLYIIAAAPLAFRQGLDIPNVSLTLLRSPLIMALFAFAVVGMNCLAVIRHVSDDPGCQLAGRPGLRVPAAWLEPYRVGTPSQERVYCSDFTLCNSYLWAGAKTVLDGRVDPFPMAVYESTKTINGMHKGWQREITKLTVNVIVVADGLSRLNAAMAKMPSWHIAATDDDCTTYVKRIGQYPGRHEYLSP